MMKSLLKMRHCQSLQASMQCRLLATTSAGRAQTNPENADHKQDNKEKDLLQKLLSRLRSENDTETIKVLDKLQRYDLVCYLV
jgi:hypothetical protein